MNPAPVTALAGRYYNAAEIFAAIKARVFFATWQYAGHASQAQNPGDYFTCRLFDQDLFVMRGEDNQLRAFYNVCRHRGHKLLADCGNKRRIVCPYHAWTYACDGRLINAPMTQNLPGFDAAAIRLAPVKVENFLNFIFVNLDAHAPDMDACYPGVRDALCAACPDIAELQFAHEHFADEECNWLVAVENYNECYHCKKVHAQFSAGVIAPDTYNIKPFGEGKVLHHSAQAARGDGAWYDNQGGDYASFFLWPAASIQVYPGGVVNGYYWRPLAIDATRAHRTWFSRDGKVDAELQNIIDLDRETTFAEDLELVKNVQRGLQSQGYAPGPLVVDPAGGIHNELSIAALHSWVRDAVA